jgi:hypothetical protein
VEYRHKVIALSALVGGLTLIYVASLVFNPERMAERGSSFSLLDDKSASAIQRIEIEKGATKTVLEKSGAGWTVNRAGVAYPAKKERVADLLAALAVRDAYPRLASAASSHAALGLTDSAAAYVSVFSAAGKPLLALLVGNTDAAGKNVDLRLAGSDEVFTGLDRFSSFLSGGQRAWFNLALFAADPVSAQTIQRIIVTAAVGSYTLARDSEAGWRLEGKKVALDTMKVDAYAKGLATAEADDFAETGKGVGGTEATIVVETGDGRSRKIAIGRAGVEGRSEATVSSSPHLFSLELWNVERLVREESYFYERAAMNER